MEYAKQIPLRIDQNQVDELLKLKEKLNKTSEQATIRYIISNYAKIDQELSAKKAELSKVTGKYSSLKEDVKDFYRIFENLKNTVSKKNE